MAAVGTPWLVFVFAAGAAATWVGGAFLSETTVAAASQGNLGLAAGNLIGGIAVQTMVLVLCDFVVGRERPLTFLVGALTPVLEGMLVVLVVSGVLMGSLLNKSTAIGGVVSPASIAIVAIWA